jgi:hypothetical protein
MVAGVENAGEFVVGSEEGVGFVDHESGPKFFDCSIQRGRADVGGDEGTIDQTRKNIEEG